MKFYKRGLLNPILSYKKRKKEDLKGTRSLQHNMNMKFKYEYLINYDFHLEFRTLGPKIFFKTEDVTLIFTFESIYFYLPPFVLIRLYSKFFI